MDRQRPTPMPLISLLRSASTVLVLLAGFTGADRPASAATNPATAADSSTAALRRLEATLRTCGASVSAEARAGADVVVAANARRVDDVALRSTPLIAERLAHEFGTTSRALTDERSRLGASWSELVIAHTLAANLPSLVSPSLLVELHRDGIGWGLMAAGFGLDLSDVVNAVRIECRVASGLLPADGRVVEIRGEGLNSTPSGAEISAAIATS